MRNITNKYLPVLTKAVLITTCVTINLAHPASELTKNEWALCDVWNLPEIKFAQMTKSNNEIISQGGTYMSANSLYGEKDTLSTLIGDVRIQRSEELLSTDRVDFNSSTGYMHLIGRIRFKSIDSYITADSAIFTSSTDSGQFLNAEYYLQKNHINGHAKVLSKNEELVTILQDTSYTTCNPNNPDWIFKASEIRLDEKKGFGYGKHTRLYYKKIPIFYFPAFTFPINDKRKSGFLVPAIGTSNNRGTEISIPYYLNIAPQFDSTLAIHNMTERGTQYASQLRYKTKKTNNTLKLEYLEDEKLEDERSSFHITHNGRWPAKWKTQINYIDTSDINYHADGLIYNFSDVKSEKYRFQRISNTKRNVRLYRNTEFHRFKIELSDFLIKDPQTQPLQIPHTILPSLTHEINYPELPWQLRFSMKSELVRFEHDDKLGGDRFDIHPAISRTFGTPGWFIKPQLSIRHTQYQHYSRVEPRPNDELLKPSRTLPLLSIDNGLIFERKIGTNNQYVQTLEPRIYYLNIPYRDQSRIPVFSDTRNTNFSFAQLFRANKFTGADRVNDANQISTTISSRILDNQAGKELFRASIGRIEYFDDRQVTLRGNSLQTEKYSNLITEISTLLNNRWSTGLTVDYDTKNNDVEKGTARLRYTIDNNHIVNFGYRFRRDILDQAEIAWRWPISKRWTSVGKWQYSLLNDQTHKPNDIDTFLGLEYESCCYVFRFIGRRFLNLDGYENEILLQFSFKGFTQFGSNATDLLEQHIIGFEDIY